MAAARKRQRYKGVSGKVVMRSPADLTPHPRNSRTHTEAQVAQVGASIKRFGFNAPVLVKGDLIVAGHARVLAAAHIGMAQVPTIDVSHMTDDEVRAYLIADNKHAENAEWDVDVLAVEAADMIEMGISHDEMGFDGTEDYLDIVTGAGGETDPDAVPEAPADPISRLGDVWVCGDHRIMCGDAKDAEAVTTLLDGAQPNLMVTDPPYGVNYHPEWRVTAGLNVSAPEEVPNDNTVDWTSALGLFEGNVMYLWHAGVHAPETGLALHDLDFEIRAQIIWAKQHFVISRGAYHWKHEPCWYAVRKGKNANWRAGRKETTVWEVSNSCAFGGNVEDGKTVHGTQKPVEVMRRPMVNHTDRGDHVYDPFVGSGTSVIAAEQEGRRCLAMDVDPVYVDVAVKRWEDFTGKKATLVRARPVRKRSRVRGRESPQG